MYFPTFKTNDLNDDDWALPQDFDHTFNLLFIAYHLRHQHQIYSWLPTAELLEQQHPDLRYYEIPVVGRMGWFRRKRLNYWMRIGLQSYDMRSRTLTIYENRDQFCHNLAIDTQHEITLLLLNGRGEEIWRTTGWHSPEKESRLRGQMS